MIDLRDIAATTAVVLATDGLEGQTYELTGREAITYGEIAEELSVATGRPVDGLDGPDEAARQGLVEGGVPDCLVERLIALFGTSDRARLSRPPTPHAP